LIEDDLHSRRHRKEGLGGACKTAYADVGFIVEDVPPPGSCEFDLTQAGYFRGNFRVELTARLRRGELNGGFGLKFGMATNDNRSYYTFGVTGNGSYLLAGWNGSWRVCGPCVRTTSSRNTIGPNSPTATARRGMARTALWWRT